MEERLTLYLYDCEYIDGYNKYLDITITTSEKEAYAERRVRLETITLSKAEIRELAGLDKADIKRGLFSKFGITDLSSHPGQPKGPYYLVDEDVYKALGV